MICNTGIGLVPNVNGAVHTFTEQGLYDGLFLMYDYESGTRWNHMTGEAVYGPLVGEQLPVTNVLHTTVEQILAENPDALLAWSEHPSAIQRSGDRGGILSGLLDRILDVPDMFPATMGHEDGRRDRMEMGIGIWTEEQAKYYPLSAVQSQQNALLDRFAGDQVLIFYDPAARALVAEVTEADSYEWDGRILRLSNGDRVEDGVLYDESRVRKEWNRPLQVFTRWYGFSFTFPETLVYERPIS